MYKVQNNLSPKHIVDLFNKKDTKYELRNADFTIPRYNTITYGKHSMRFLGPKIRKQLDKKEKEIKTLEQFKRTIRQKDLLQMSIELHITSIFFKNRNQPFLAKYSIHPPQLSFTRINSFTQFVLIHSFINSFIHPFNNPFIHS